MQSERKRISKSSNRSRQVEASTHLLFTTNLSLQSVARAFDGALSSAVLSPTDRMRLHRLTQCYDQYTGDPSILKYFAPTEILSLRLHEFFNRKKPILINFISYFKHLPEFDQVDVDDQVLLIKQNIRLLLPINYALLKTPTYSQFRSTNIQTIGCLNNINLDTIYQHLSNSFVDFVTADPVMIKTFLIILFFTPNSQSINFDSVEYHQIMTIKRIQSSYAELLWLYLMEKWGEVQAIHLFTKVIAAYLRLQIIIDRIDSIIRANDDVQYLDSLMKTILQLTWKWEGGGRIWCDILRWINCSLVQLVWICCQNLMPTRRCTYSHSIHRAQSDSKWCAMRVEGRVCGEIPRYQRCWSRCQAMYCGALNWPWRSRNMFDSQSDDSIFVVRTNTMKRNHAYDRHTKQDKLKTTYWSNRVWPDPWSQWRAICTW